MEIKNAWDEFDGRGDIGKKKKKGRESTCELEKLARMGCGGKVELKI